MIKLSVPVIVEKMAFSLGKVVVNSMSTVYGTLTVGALGISNNIESNIADEPMLVGNSPSYGYKQNRILIYEAWVVALVGKNSSHHTLHIVEALLVLAYCGHTHHGCHVVIFGKGVLVVE